MSHPRPLVKKPDVPVKKLFNSCTLFCPLFEHQKDTSACTVLRAKRVCRVNCSDYFEFALKNEDSVRAVLLKYRPLIFNGYQGRKDSKTTEQLLQEVMPRGENVCGHCGKAFKFEGTLKRHIKKKHRRETESSREKSLRRTR